MIAPLVCLNESSSPAAIATRELQLELSYLPIALTLDINHLLSGCKYQNFTAKYARFAIANPTPSLLVEGELQAALFVEHCGFKDDIADGAVIWAISRCWKAKAAAHNILRPEVAEQYRQAEFSRDQRTELHKAVSRIAKNKSEDSFEAGFRVKVTQTLSDAGAHQLAQLTGRIEE